MELDSRTGRGHTSKIRMTHAVDDSTSQPNGAAGGSVSCSGIIQ